MGTIKTKRNSKKICLLIMLIIWVLSIVLTVIFFRQNSFYQPISEYSEIDNQLSTIRWLTNTYWSKLNLGELTVMKNNKSIPRFSKQEYLCLLTEFQELLMLMSETGEAFSQIQNWINETSFTPDEPVRVGDTVRCTLGSLLSLYSTSGMWFTSSLQELQLYKNKAVEVAEGLLPAFDSRTGVPYPLVNPRSKAVSFEAPPKPTFALLEDFGGFHMEFCYLSKVTGDETYCNVVTKLRNYILKHLGTTESHNQAPNFFDPEHEGHAGGFCPISSCFHKQLLLSRPNEKTSAALYQMITNSPEGSRVSGTISFFALLCEATKNEGYSDFGAQLLHIYENAFRMKYHIDKNGVIDIATVPEIQTHAELVEAYFYMTRATPNSYTGRSGHITRFLRNSFIIKAYMENGEELPSFEDARLTLKTLRYIFLLYSDIELLDRKIWMLNCDGHPMPREHEVLHINQNPSVESFNYSAADIEKHIQETKITAPSPAETLPQEIDPNEDMVKPTLKPRKTNAGLPDLDLNALHAH